jgi:hypothetical protein
MNKILLGAVTLFIVSACSPIANQDRAGAEKVHDMSLCPAERPQVCTMEYRATCGHLDDGKRKDYASPCSACADPAVVGVFEGSCDSQ